MSVQNMSMLIFRPLVTKCKLIKSGASHPDLCLRVLVEALRLARETFDFSLTKDAKNRVLFRPTFLSVRNSYVFVSHEMLS